jgi:OOP family OmpA-OmpF porin
MMKRPLLIALLGIATAIPFSVQAQGGYIGLNVGRANNDPDIGGVTVLSKDEKDTGFKFYGGYGFTRNWGAEVGFADLGKVNNVYRAGTSNIGLNYRAKSLYAAGTGTLPLTDRFSLFGKLGIAANRTSGGASASGLTFNGRGTHSSLMGGIGAKFNFTPNLGLVVEYEDFGKVDDGSAKANMWSAGVRYQF